MPQPIIIKFDHCHKNLIMQSVLLYAIISLVVNENRVQ